MVLWCRECKELVGLREPMDDWSCDRTGVCPVCIGKSPELAEQTGKVVADEPLDDD